MLFRSGPITSVLAAAGCVVLMNRILMRFELAALPRALWIVTTLANPVVLYHAVNGTAESMFVLCFLWTFLAAIDIEQTRVAPGIFLHHLAIPLESPLSVRILCRRVLRERDCCKERGEQYFFRRHGVPSRAALTTESK